MSQLIPQGFIDDLLSRVDVVDVVSSRIKLKKTGKNYSACCPFHNEKTPSFSVSPDKQFFYCFGCGCSGSALKFVMDYDNISFPEAVEKLAAQAGLEVPKEPARAQDIRQQQEQSPLFELMQKAGHYYEHMLRSHSDKAKAVSYLKGRGLSGKAAKFFGIGYAPNGWDNLHQALNPNNDKALTQQLIACGMLIEKEDGHAYDRFRDRIMFPIRDVRGRYIAFGGRVLTNEKPKYLNSPETAIFHKGQELYGLYEARQVRQKLTRLMLVEGYMDVVALAEAGIHYALATLGTATSEQHLRRIFKMVSEVIFCFDGDNAGRTAAARAMEVALPLLEDGLQARFLFLPEGEDPDSLVRKEGKDAFEERLDHAIHLPEFLFEHLKKQVDFTSLNGKARLDQLAAPLISRLPNGTLRNLMKQKLNDELGTVSTALAKYEAAPITARPESVRLAPAQNSAPLVAPIPTMRSAPAQTGLEELATKALADLIRKPELARDITPIEHQAESEAELLFFSTLSKLKDSPQDNSTGVILFWMGSPYVEQIIALANLRTELPINAGQINELLRRLQVRHMQTRFHELEQKYQLNTLSDPAERLEYISLKQELHKATAKRAR
ncbi:MAG: hypothetical protein RL217_1889 [Pseudomonadota bacterium]|jgi:DNA primase